MATAAFEIKVAHSPIALHVQEKKRKGKNPLMDNK